MPTPTQRLDRASLVLIVVICLVVTGVMALVPDRILGAGLVYQGF